MEGITEKLAFELKLKRTNQGENNLKTFRVLLHTRKTYKKHKEKWKI